MGVFSSALPISSSWQIPSWPQCWAALLLHLVAAIPASAAPIPLFFPCPESLSLSPCLTYLPPLITHGVLLFIIHQKSFLSTQIEVYYVTDKRIHFPSIMQNPVQLIFMWFYYANLFIYQNKLHSLFRENVLLLRNYYRTGEKCGMRGRECMEREGRVKREGSRTSTQR